MKNIITKRNMKGCWDPGEMTGHWIVLGPMMSIHAMLQIKYEDFTSWCWTVKGVQEALETNWNMTGAWKARRAITFKKTKFEDKIVTEIPKIANVLNKYNVSCMRDFGELYQKEYEKIVRTIQLSIETISDLRKTKIKQPVLGSKVLHHFFPSVVPVFDEALVLNAGLKTQLFTSEIQKTEEHNISELYNEGWIFLEQKEVKKYSRMHDYHKYFGFCAKQIHETEIKTLKEIRASFGNDFSKLMPYMLVNRKNSILYKLDAKIAEYCLLGVAKKEGLI